MLQSGGALKEGSEEVIGAAEKTARTFLNSNVQLRETPRSETKSRELLQTSAATRPGDPDHQRFVGIMFDPVQMGEAVTAPHLCNPPVDLEVIKARLG